MIPRYDIYLKFLMLTEKFRQAGIDEFYRLHNVKYT